MSPYSELAKVEPGAVSGRDLVWHFRRLRAVWFWLLTAGYLLVGRALADGLGWVSGDALSRVASARFALDSRDPHLSAIGFVFTPLTTLLELPLVALLGPWPEQLATVLPGAIVSAMAMSGAVLQLAGLLRDRRSSEGWVLAICAVFALHPMIVLYAGNGMSEALFLLCSMVCCRFLLRWLGTDDVHDLAAVGLSMGLGYLVRYDAVAMAIAVAALVGLFSMLRARGSRRQRRDAALMDVAVVAMPVLTAFTLWALVSWLITGEAFQQFTSEYGNSAIVAATATDAAPTTVGARILTQLLDWMALEPAVLAVLFVSLAIGLVRWVPDFLPPLFVFGSVLGFQALTFATGGTFALLRFSISVIPLVVVMVAVMRPRIGLLFTRRAGPAAWLAGSRHRLARHRSLATWLALVTLLLPGMVVPVVAMARSSIAPQEFGVVNVLVPGLQSPEVRLAGAQQLRTFHAEREIAAQLDAMDLPEGAVLTDTVYGFAVVVASQHPRQFTINSDFDFVNRLNDPRERGVQYLLTVPETGRGTTDAVNQRYPGIYADGAGIGYLVREFPTSGSSDQPSAFRLYRVTGS